jgi:hypothetical protein
MITSREKIPPATKDNHLPNLLRPHHREKVSFNPNTLKKAKKSKKHLPVRQVEGLKKIKENAQLVGDFKRKNRKDRPAVDILSKIINSKKKRRGKGEKDPQVGDENNTKGRRVQGEENFNRPHLIPSIIIGA